MKFIFFESDQHRPAPLWCFFNYDAVYKCRDSLTYLIYLVCVYFLRLFRCLIIQLDDQLCRLIFCGIFLI